MGILTQGGGTVLSPTLLPHSSVGFANPLPTFIGNDYIPEIIWRGSDSTINGGLGAVTDISDPAGSGGWTTFADITYKCGVWFWSSTGVLPLVIRGAADNTAGLRLQIIGGNDIICDFISYGGAVLQGGELLVPLGTTGPGMMTPLIYDSFTVRGARLGSLTGTDTYFKFPAFGWCTL